ncbi:winged helix-turn-helix domain-containing protein [Agrobacterium sp. DE0009]|uniref:ATP-binding protein n=1 Tax=Agrobacterium sp. DE0009 TaxID=2587505 RepID=UPI0011A7C37F|nr:winged helix-turn-helix domain-containing protein [Agrobacterium sp. DE0009]
MSSGSVFEFGSFRLSAGERQLSVDGRAIRLGSRALDILLCLVRNSGNIVSNEDLMLDVWGGLHVEGVSLRVHISELRKVLSQAADADRYIVNVPGRGYSFAVPVKQCHENAPAFPAAAVRPVAQVDRLPMRPPKLVGRDDAVQRIRQELLANRFVSILGTGGIGKTTVALAVAESLLAEFAESVVFIDLAPLRNQRMVTSAFATALGLPVRGENETASIIATLDAAKILLIIDNCEHVIGAVAELTEKIFDAAPRVHLLATTREPLRVRGEKIYRLQGLAFPPEDEVMTAGTARAYPAVSLFVERARSQMDDFQLTDENAALVAQVCRGLDGLALAIELAAGRVSSLGLQGLASYLSQRFRILNRGRRTAQPRHQALRLTLDWSHDLLEDTEKIVLRRLSVFAGTFSLEAAENIASDDNITGHEVAEFLSNLVDKSLVSADVTHDQVRFRLLDTTRDYASERLRGATETSHFCRRHADYYLSLLKKEAQQRPQQSMARLRPDIDNVRVALDWCFSQGGDEEIGIALTIAAADLMTDLSLLGECTKWAAAALERLSDAQLGTHTEMALSTHFAMPLLFMRGNSQDVRQAIDRALTLAQKLEDNVFWPSTVSALFAFHLRAGNIEGMLETILRAENMTEGLQERGILEGMKCVAAFFAGDLSKNRFHAARALAVLPVKRSNNLFRIGVDYRIWCYSSCSLALWIQGFRDQAKEMARQSLEEAEMLGSPVPLATGLVWGTVLALWAGDLDLAEQRNQRLLECSTRSALLPFRFVADGHSGTLSVLKGNVNRGIELLERSVSKLLDTNSRLQEILMLGQLAQAYAEAGRYRDARELVDKTLMRIRETGTKIYLADLMRMRAVFLWHELGDREAYVAGLQQALMQARSDGILSVELRILARLAKIAEDPVSSSHALAALRETFGRFTEGLDSPDLVEVRHMLDQLAKA